MYVSVVRKNSIQFKRFQRAFESGSIEDEYGRQATELIVKTIRGNWSGMYPPASTPGNPPAVRTGTLDLSIYKDEVSGKWFATVNLNKAPYALHLEYGTYKMAARPFIAPAREAVKGELKTMVIQRINKTIGEALGRAGGI